MVFNDGIQSQSVIQRKILKYFKRERQFNGLRNWLKNSKLHRSTDFLSLQLNFYRFVQF